MLVWVVNNGMSHTYIERLNTCLRIEDETIPGVVCKKLMLLTPGGWVKLHSVSYLYPLDQVPREQDLADVLNRMKEYATFLYRKD